MSTPCSERFFGPVRPCWQSSRTEFAPGATGTPLSDDDVLVLFDTLPVWLRCVGKSDVLLRPDPDRGLERRQAPAAPFESRRGPNPPPGAGKAGTALWRAVLTEYELEQHEVALLTQAVRLTDLCDDFAERVAADGPLLGSSEGDRAHSAAVDLRQQAIALAPLTGSTSPAGW